MTATVELQAGRELDALVAEKVMGLTVFWRKILESYSFPNGLDEEKVANYAMLPCEDLGEAALGFEDFDGGWSYKLPRVKPYSRDIAAAWEVVEKLRSGDRFTWELHISDIWVAMLYDDDVMVHVAGFARAETMPLAICRAALKAVGA